MMKLIIKDKVQNMTTEVSNHEQANGKLLREQRS